MATQQTLPCKDVVMYDGVCALCNGFVKFVLKHDAAGRFCFAPLSSDYARAAMQRHGAASVDSVGLLVNAGGPQETLRIINLRFGSHRSGGEQCGHQRRRHGVASHQHGSEHAGSCTGGSVRDLSGTGRAQDFNDWMNSAYVVDKKSNQFWICRTRYDFSSKDTTKQNAPDCQAP